MLQTFHDGVDEGPGIFVALVGEMQVDHCGGEVVVSEVSLDDAQIDACLQEVGGIAVAERMDGDTLFAYPCLLHGPSDPSSTVSFIKLSDIGKLKQHKKSLAPGNRLNSCCRLSY